MPEIMANPDVALGAFLGSSESASGGGDSGQAQAPESPNAAGGDGAAPEAQGKPGTETPKATTAEAEAPASAADKEEAGFGEEYKPFETTLKEKKWDPKSKEFGPTVLKSYSELEKAHGQSATDKHMLHTRQTELQRRLSGDAKSINEYRKANGLPEIPVGKTYAEQVQERAEYFTHINNLLDREATPEAVKTSHAWLEKQLVEGLQDLRIKAGIEATQQSKAPAEQMAAFLERSNSNYREIAPKGSPMEAIFDTYIAPMVGPQGLLGSYGLTEAQIARSPEHLKAWAEIGKKLQLADTFEKSLADGIAKGVDERMAQTRRAGNAGSVGSQGKHTSDGGGDGFSQSLWNAAHK